MRIRILGRWVSRLVGASLALAAVAAVAAPQVYTVASDANWW
jgi:hypothetical protein